MIDGLILAREHSIFYQFIVNFSREICSFEHADSVASAKELLELEPFDYLIIIEKNCQDIVNIIGDLKKIDQYGNKPVICCATSSTWEEREKLWEQGVKDIIHLPIAKEELEFRFERFISEISNLDVDEKVVGMQGKLEDYNLFDIIQTIEQNEKSGILNLYYGRAEGKIWFYDGAICDAKCRSLEKMDAVFKLMTWLRGDFSMTFSEEEYEKKIDLDTQQILLEAIQYIDQRNKILAELPDINEILFISTMADIEHMEANEANYLRFFHGGQTISAFLFDFDFDEIELLKMVKSFIDSKYLMTRDQFDKHITEGERDLAEPGFKYVFKKFFKPRDQNNLDTIKKELSRTIQQDAETGETDESKVEKAERLFKTEKAILTRFKQEVEKLS